MGQPEIKVTGIWLRNEGEYIKVAAEIGGVWYDVIREYHPIEDCVISHIVSPYGIQGCLGDPECLSLGSQERVLEKDDENGVVEHKRE